jgi:hypothetical protein
MELAQAQDAARVSLETITAAHAHLQSQAQAQGNNSSSGIGNDLGNDTGLHAGVSAKAPRVSLGDLLNREDSPMAELRERILSTDGESCECVNCASYGWSYFRPR